MRGNKPIEVVAVNAVIGTSYTELTSAVGADVSSVIISGNQSGVLTIAMGASGSEIDLFSITTNVASAQAPQVFCSIPNGARIAVKAAAATVSGNFRFTLLN